MGNINYETLNINQPVVEIDETLWGHLIDDNRDIFQNQLWVLGIFDRAENFFKAYIIKGPRNEANLLPFIINNVATINNHKTIIFTDGNLAYSNLSNYNYSHRIIIHENWFGLGFNTTNHIESCWATLKYYTRKFFRGQNYCSYEQFENRLNGLLYYINIVSKLGDEKNHLLELLSYETETICDVLNSMKEYRLIK